MKIVLSVIVILLGANLMLSILDSEMSNTLRERREIIEKQQNRGIYD